MLDEVDKCLWIFAAILLRLVEVLILIEPHLTIISEVDYDLSSVMFMATANTLNIPPALRDRMEVIRIPGYTEEEKVNIALRHLIPKQIKAAGLKAKEIELPAETVQNITRYYTREAGVRNLEREISKICRKVVKEVLLKTKSAKARVEPEDLEQYLGVRRYRYDIAEQQDQIGQVKGLAWTEVGGELLRQPVLLVREND